MGIVLLVSTERVLVCFIVYSEQFSEKMGRKRGKRVKAEECSRQEKEEEDSEEDAVFTPSAKSKKRSRITSDSDSESSRDTNIKEETGDCSSPTKLSKKRKIRSFLESSDEENIDTNINTTTPKIERMKKLQQMSKNVQAKKGLYISSEEEEESEDEDDLPMFQNEEELPEDALKSEIINEDSNLEDFVVDDDVVELEEQTDDDDEEGEEEEEEESTDSEDDHQQKRSKRLRKMKKKSRKSKTSNVEGEEEEEEDYDYDYANPYKQMDEAFESSDIIDILSKNTANDKKNARLYKKEMGKYQFSVRSVNNKAAQLSKKARFAINMDQVKTDRGFKAERNLDVKDDEFYDYVERCLYGERLRIFPHTKRVSMYNTRCSLNGCGEKLLKGESKVIGTTKFRFYNY